MKNLIKLESAALLIVFTGAYFYLLNGHWGLYLALFFVPDLSFAFYLISKKIGAIAYNLLHHQGIMAILLVAGYFSKEDTLIQVALIFLAHSTFDRVAGYGLKYYDGFDHTHLGWIGKSKHLNKD
jgi:hypothetical protein